MNTNIYVCAHKDYNDVGINNACYKLISDKDIKNNSTLEFIKSFGELDNRLWSELTQIYHVWKHEKLTDNIGFCHYRRYFDFKNDVPNIVTPIVPKPINNIFNNYISYDICHNSKDLLNTVNIAIKHFPKYKNSLIEMLDSHLYFQCNMFIFPKDMFCEYCEFIFTTLLELDKKYNINNDYIKMIKHIGNNREHYVEKEIELQKNYDYQARLYGFIAERLTTAFILYYADKINFNTHDIVQV